MNHDQIAMEDFKPKFLAKTTMAKKAADAAIGSAKSGLAFMAKKHGRDLQPVDPRWTTMDCSKCGARTKHCLPMSQRTYFCDVCGLVSSRDKNSAAVMVVRAGFNPAGVDGIRPWVSAGHSGCLSQESPGFSRGEVSIAVGQAVGIKASCYGVQRSVKSKRPRLVAPKKRRILEGVSD